MGMARLMRSLLEVDSRDEAEQVLVDSILDDEAVAAGISLDDARTIAREIASWLFE